MGLTVPRDGARRTSGTGTGALSDARPSSRSRRSRAAEPPAPRAEAQRVLAAGVPQQGAVSARTWAPPPSPLAPVSILDVRPNVDGGAFALKRVQGETLRLYADVLKEGHDHIRAFVVATAPESAPRRVEMQYDFNKDEWSADVKLDALGAWSLTVEARTDHFGTWADGLARKVKGARDVASELLEGEALLRAAAARANGRARAVLLGAALVLADPFSAQDKRAAAVTDEVLALMRTYEVPTDLSTSAHAYPVVVERGRAKSGAWYEMFPRSATDDPQKHGTLRSAAKRLQSVRDMGFDVVYLPPIHPIGERARKGRNNSEDALPGDVGSPWAIGSRFGGHDAVHPALGTVDDFVAFVGEANRLGMEVALDFAVQCAPDHPWVTEHPDWFKRRPDGTIQYAENPPKVYQDIVQLDMWGPKREEMWHALKGVMDAWIDRGVKIFRVDNPHTKPPAFWQWLIDSVHAEHPDVVFLSEAFARPKKQDLYAKLGFSQSYTYFTWKNSRAELESFMQDIVHNADFMRPNFFANTPDILSDYLQKGGRPAFEVRYALAATLSPSFGIYSGYELVENKALKGEDYLDSEKYEIKARDPTDRGIKDWVAKINRIKRENPELAELVNYRQHNADNAQIFSFSKDRVLVVANLDTANTQEATLHLDGVPLGLNDGSSYTARDLVTGNVFSWQGLHNYVKLAPGGVHIFKIEGG